MANGLNGNRVFGALGLLTGQLKSISADQTWNAIISTHLHIKVFRRFQGSAIWCHSNAIIVCGKLENASPTFKLMLDYRIFFLLVRAFNDVFRDETLKNAFISIFTNKRPTRGPHHWSRKGVRCRFNEVYSRFFGRFFFSSLSVGGNVLENFPKMQIFCSKLIP